MLDTKQSVAAIVLDHSETAAVFLQNRIDYCCKGQLSVADACAQRGIDPKVLVAELERVVAERRETVTSDPRALGVPGLIEHILTRHHSYLRRALPFVKAMAVKVSRVHGDHQSSLRELEKTVLALCEALEPHLAEEEKVLFPALVSGEADADIIRREFESMHRDHIEVGKLLERIHDLTDGYKPADWACNSYRALYGELAALESDVFRHVHLENHVLMPRFASS